MRKGKREQEGIMHVYFRANGRYTVFYDDEDNLKLLKIIGEYAKKYDSVVMDFALMVNHAHFLIKTECVTKLMRESLKNYSRWYNKKYKNSNKLFHTPFSSACKHTEEWVLESCAYILQNPVKAKMCSKVEQYKWSSVYFHFRNYQNKFIADKKILNKISEVIDISTEFVDRYFKDYNDFLSFANYNPIMLSKVVPKKSMWEISTFEKLSGELDRVLNGRMVNNLTKEEVVKLIVHLKNYTTCNMLQISSLLHVDYSFVKNCIKKLGIETVSEIEMDSAPQQE